ncbi:MAG TPA: c-type cytochrome [Thermoanaerobaculia bacterium]
MLGAILFAVLVPSGEAIYRTGATPGGEIIAGMAGGEVRVSATVVPCSNCHGADGRGSIEGGIVSPDIRWQSLSKPYKVAATLGRERAPYTKKQLVRAIAMGIDSSGNTLAPVMPRFAMTSEQMSALIGYLEALDTKPVPGVSDARVRVGVLAPQEVMPALETFFAKQSVYGRRIEPVSIGADLRAAIRNDDLLAIAPAFVANDAEKLARIADEEQIPMLTTMTSHPANGAKSFRWTRDLFGGVDDQKRALTKFANETLGIATPVFHGAVLRHGDRSFVALPVTMHDSDAKLRPGELAALAAASVLVDALQRAGRDVTRTSLLRAINTTRDFRTGYSPPMTFAPNRGIGSTGMWIVELSAQEPRAVWVP